LEKKTLLSAGFISLPAKNVGSRSAKPFLKSALKLGFAEFADLKGLILTRYP